MQLGNKQFFNIKRRPYELFGVFAFIFFLLHFIPSKGSLDFYIRADYYIIEPNFICGYTAIYLLFMWMLYFLARKIMWQRWMTWMHLVCTIIVFTAFVLTIYLPNPLDGVPRRYYTFSEYQKQDVLIWSKVIPYLVFVFLAGQMVFLINVVGGLIKSLTRR